MIDAVECHRIVVPMRTPLATARGTVRERRVVLVGVHRGGAVGWGEAAPYPGATRETDEDVWRAIADGRVVDSSLAAAAWSEAVWDLEARLAGRPLWAAVGASGGPVAASLAVGLSGDPVAAVDTAVGLGYRAVKLKIAPGADVAVVEAVRRRHPDLSVGVDANGAYRPGSDDGVFAALDGLGVAYVEQPYPVGAEDDAARLRSRVGALVALDESVGSVEEGVGVIEREAADLLVLKPGRLGIDGVLALHAAAVAAGLRVKVSGLVETGIGRAHAVALAGLPGAVHSDVARPQEFLVADPTSGAFPIVDGTIVPPPGPGIGVEPSLEGVRVLSSRRREVR